MANLPFNNPSPDFDEFVQVITGEKQPKRVYFAELSIDHDIMQYIVEKKMGGKWVPAGEASLETMQKQVADFYFRMGYDYVPTGPDWLNLPDFKERSAKDTAQLARGERKWVDESGGIIKTWEDFEKVDWDSIKPDMSRPEFVEKYLHDGMKTTSCCVFFEMILERFLGYEDLFILSIEEPELVEAVFEKWGQIIYQTYQQIAPRPKVGAIWHADDLGYGTGTMLSPEFLRKNVFPWFKKYAELAHENGKPYIYHCCGNVSEVMEDLIVDVKIDVFHSFQDTIISVGDFRDKYDDRIGALGGIDLDKLCRLPGPELRDYIRQTLDRCMPGRYALGSGNSIANYVPPENYLIMLEEGLKWKG